MKVKVQKNVPMPQRNHKLSTYPYATMAVGESFMYLPSGLSSARQQAHLAGKKYGRKFSIRSTADGVRCWRIE